jgi:hypothetical protein
MTTTNLPRNGSTQSSAVPPLPMVSTARRQRRRGLLALALALVVLFAVGTVATFNYFSATHSAVGVARTVPYGQQVNAGDLVEVSIPTVTHWSAGSPRPPCRPGSFFPAASSWPR